MKTKVARDAGADAGWPIALEVISAIHVEKEEEEDEGGVSPEQFGAWPQPI